KEYWTNRFKDGVPVVELPTDYARPAVQTFDGDRVSFTLNQELTRQLKEICQETGVTMYMLLMSAYQVWLSKHTGQEDIVVGTVSAGRSHVDLQQMIGMFVNTLVIRADVNAEKTFRKFLEEMKEELLEAFENQDYQFEELVEALSLPRETSRNPLFDTMFVLENIDVPTIPNKGLQMRNYEWNHGISKFDMTIVGQERGNQLHFQWEYATKLYKEETINKFKERFIRILETIVQNIDQSIGELEIITEKEKHQLLYEFNNTKTEFPKEKTLSQLFEEQVKKTPNNIAVAYKDQSLTYRELNERANQLAHMLRSKGIVREEIVGIMLERSVEMLVGILGVLKAGGAYLPIDPEYPEERITYMLEDSQAQLVLTQTHLIKKLNIKRMILDLQDTACYSSNCSNPERINQSNDVAYIIYTSGSTGKPKGVVVEHQSVINLCFWHQEYFQ
ncbi:condensation domain-containing protein, partial [Bacillus cereus]|uniref:non-ribosomal peptide synthetase n=5 Tax=Bacillus TaxID=1386 RepID=UPI001D0853D0